jgi:CRISPR-associated protein Csh1
MLESLRQIGELYRDKPSILSEPIRRNFKKEPVILQIIFDLDNNKVYYQDRKYQPKLVEDYMWIGHTFSATRERIARLTFTDRKYFPEVITNLINRLPNNEETKDLIDILTEIKLNLIDRDTTLQTDLTSYVENMEGYEVVFYTICAKRDGKTIELAKQNTYAKAIQYLISPASSRTKGICHVCGKEKEVYTDPAFESGTMLKMYIVDQPGYLAGVSSKKNKSSLLRTYSICPDCRYSLIIGEKKITRDFKVKIGDLRVNVLPKTGLLRETSEEDLDKILQEFRSVSEGLGVIAKLEENLEEGWITDDWYSLTLIFGERRQADFDYLGMIEEVPITQITNIRTNIMKISKDAMDIWTNDDQKTWYLTLDTIVKMIPLRVFSEKVEFFPLIDLLTALLKNHQYPYRRLIRFALTSACAHRFESYQGLKIHKEKSPDLSLVMGMLKFNYLMLLMQEMGLMSQNVPETYELNVEEEVQKWIKQMRYDSWKTALFLMGYLIGKIGNAQYNKEDKRKSILDKIDFKGMKWDRILRLVGEIMNSLRNYRILEYNEGVYHEMCKLIDQSRALIEKNDPEENLFYILTGYSFATYGSIRRGQNQ